MSENQTTVIEADEPAMKFDLIVNGEEITVNVTGYEDPMNALRALYLLGKPDQLADIAQRYDVAEAEHFVDA